VTLRLDFPPAQLDRLRAESWQRWLSVGASTRRMFAREWTEATSTAVEVRAKVEAVVPDAYFAPGERRTGSQRRNVVVENLWR
jgi:hypothetical protein